MTLGEFRNRTAELPDDAELIIVNIFNEKFYGKSAGELTIIPSNSAKITDGSTNFVSTPGFDEFGFSKMKMVSFCMTPVNRKR